MLNSEHFHERCRRDAQLSLMAGPMGIDSGAVKLLNEILARTSAEIIISSSWRQQRSLARLHQALIDRGLKGNVRDVTPMSGGLGRGGEIRAWLDDNPVDGFVVLDDLSPSAGLDDWWVQTDSREGLTRAACKRAIEICLRPGIR